MSLLPQNDQELTSHVFTINNSNNGFSFLYKNVSSVRILISNLMRWIKKIKN